MGTSIDEIARVAGVSRASFYTYFPSKRDALLALGASSASEAGALVDELRATSFPWSPEDIETWIHKYFAYLDEHGSFVFAWTQAAHDDRELRAAGMKRHLALCRRLGEAFDHLRGGPLGDPTQQGILALSMLERGWSYGRLYAGTLDETEMRTNAALLMARALCPVNGEKSSGSRKADPKRRRQVSST